MIEIVSSLFHYIVGFVSCLILLIIVALVSFFKDSKERNKLIAEVLKECIEEQGRNNDTDV